MGHFPLRGSGFELKSALLVGVVAQLVERLVRNEEVRGSTPLGSTILRSEPRQRFRAKDGSKRGSERRMVVGIYPRDAQHPLLHYLQNIFLQLRTSFGVSLSNESNRQVSRV